MTSARKRAMPLGKPAAWLVAAGCMLALSNLWPASAQAQSTTLVTNADKATNPNVFIGGDNRLYAQPFNTGSWSDGYIVASASIRLSISSANTDSAKPTLHLYSSDTEGLPDQELLQFQNRRKESNNLFYEWFVSTGDESDATLSPNTTYHIVAKGTHFNHRYLHPTNSSGQDGSSASGWTINTKYWHAADESNPSWEAATSEHYLKIRVKGTAVVPTASVAAGSVATEGSPATFTVSRTGETTNALTVLLSVSEAASGDMVDAAQEGEKQVVIPVGDASADYSVTTVGDETDEQDSSVTISIRTDDAYKIDPSSGQATVPIQDDDLPVVSIQSESGGGSVPEGSPATFTVSRAGDTTVALTVLLSVSEAAPGGDMVDATQEGEKEVVIPVGDASADYSVTTAGDSANEDDSSVTVGIRSSSAYQIDSNSSLATVAIEDDDEPDAVDPGDGNPALPAVSISSPSVREPLTPGSTASLDFAVTLDSASDQVVTVDYQTRDGTATADLDYVPASGTLSFQAGETSKMIAVEVLYDFIAEVGGETVVVALSNASGAAIAATTGTGVIEDPPGAVRSVLSATPPQVRYSGNDDRTTIEFALLLSPPLDHATDVDWTVAVSNGAVLTGTAIVPANIRSHAVEAGTVNGKIAAGTTISLSLAEPRAAGAGSVSPSVAAAPPGDAADNGRVVVATVTVRAVDQNARALANSLSGLGRSMAVDIVDAIWSRAADHAAGGASRAVVAGHALDAGALAGHAGAGRAAVELAGVFGVDAIAPKAAGSEPQGKTLASGDFGALLDWAGVPDERRLVDGTRFALALGGPGGAAGSTTIWGSSSFSSFEGSIGDPAFDRFHSDGEVVSGHLGFDYRLRDDLVLGLAVSRASADVDFSFDSGSGDGGRTDASLAGVAPYAHWMPASGISVWGAAGASAGSAELSSGGGLVEADIDMRMAAAGVRRDLFVSGDASFAAKADAYLAELSAEGMDADANSSRVRLAVEALAGRSLDGSGDFDIRVDLGARLDGGSAESGLGADLSGEVAYVGEGGLSIQWRGGMLVHHEEEYEEVGMSLGATWDPGAQGVGFALSVEPTWNAPRSNAAEAMWTASGIAADRAAAGGGVLRSRLGYGEAVLHGRALATLYGEVERAGESGSLRMGLEMRKLARDFGELSIDLHGEREEGGSTDPRNSAMLSVKLSF